MKAHKSWSYAPYRPPFFYAGDIYICRIAPAENSITFDWLDIGAAQYDVYYRVKDEGAFVMAGQTSACTYTIGNLVPYCDYEFYVCADSKTSRVRMARCHESLATVVNYLHPDDDAYCFSGKCLCSPSLVRHPDGYLLASMDVFAGNYPQNLTLIYRSDDDGATWHYVSELFPCFWGKMFVCNGDLYMLACSTEYGDLLIGKSSDGGKSFCEPTVLLRGSGGKNGETGVHKNPQPVVEFGGRIWNTLEWGSWGRGYHAAMVMSAPSGCDLLNADNWAFSEPVRYNPAWKGVAVGRSSGNIEGCLTVVGDKLYNIMRYDMTCTTPNYGLVTAYEVDTAHPESPLQYSHCIEFPANHSKFVIKYDKKTALYYSIVSLITDEKNINSRNILALMVSEDCCHWRVQKRIYDKSDCNPMKIGLQYVDFIIEGDEILFLCRAAFNNAKNFHDSDYSIFDRIKIR
ncbi:MAG: hypothetical protein ACI4RV_08245 [Eubacteriales bacterium]